MKKAFLILAMSVAAHSAYAGVFKRDVKCIAAGGLELTIPGGGGFFMQPIDLNNDYDVNFLAGLISRHRGQKTTDKNVRINIGMGNCKLKEDLSLSCDDNGFGSATYGYSLNDDYVTVNTPVSGHINLKLARDAKGIFQLELTLTNDKIKDGILVIKKAIGPLSDPTQTSLTPWSPGCLFTEPEQ